MYLLPRSERWAQEFGNKTLCSQGWPGCFMNCRRETVEKGVPPGNRRGLDPRRT
jgi:hypothetical protein